MDGWGWKRGCNLLTLGFLHIVYEVSIRFDCLGRVLQNQENFMMAMV